MGRDDTHLHFIRILQGSSSEVVVSPELRTDWSGTGQNDAPLTLRANPIAKSHNTSKVVKFWLDVQLLKGKLPIFSDFCEPTFRATDNWFPLNANSRKKGTLLTRYPNRENLTYKFRCLIPFFDCTYFNFKALSSLARLSGPNPRDPLALCSIFSRIPVPRSAPIPAQIIMIRKEKWKRCCSVHACSSCCFIEFHSAEFELTSECCKYIKWSEMSVAKMWCEFGLALGVTMLYNYCCFGGTERIQDFIVEQ